MMNSLNCKYSIISVLNKSNYKLIIDELDNFFDLGVHNFSVNYFLPSGRGRFSDLRLSSEEMFYTYKSILDKLANKLKKDNILIFEKNMYYFIKKMITKKKFLHVYVFPLWSWNFTVCFV